MKQPTKKKAERKGKVKAGKPMRAYAGIICDGASDYQIDPHGESIAWGQGDTFTIKWAAAVYKRRKAAASAYESIVPVTIVPGHIGKDFKIVPSPTP